MKKYLFLFLAISFTLVSCEKDEDPITELELHLDGPNQSAPFFDPGTYEAAARFTANYTREYEGKNLEAVEFYLAELPDQCEVRIYDIGSATEPGDLLYSAEITNLGSNAWNKHTLNTPLELSGDDLWISIKVTTDERSNIMGCDPGPANSNGDWTFSSEDNAWQTYRDRTNNIVNINWNIRGDVAD